MISWNIWQGFTRASRFNGEKRKTGEISFSLTFLCMKYEIVVLYFFLYLYTYDAARSCNIVLFYLYRDVSLTAYDVTSREIIRRFVNAPEILLIFLRFHRINLLGKPHTRGISVAPLWFILWSVESSLCYFLPQLIPSAAHLILPFVNSRMRRKEMKSEFSNTKSWTRYDSKSITSFFIFESSASLYRIWRIECENSNFKFRIPKAPVGRSIHIA